MARTIMEPSRGITKRDELLEGGPSPGLGEGGLRRKYFQFPFGLFGCLAAVGVGAHHAWLHFTSEASGSASPGYFHVTLTAGSNQVVRRLRDEPKPSALAGVEGSLLEEVNMESLKKSELKKGVSRDVTENPQADQTTQGKHVTERSVLKQITMARNRKLKEATHCKWALWSEWQACSLSCGGQKSRSRNVEVHASNGGQECAGGAHESSPCPAQACGEVVTSIKFARSRPGRKCENEAYLRPFLPMSDSVEDAKTARDRCEAYCKTLKSCWGCSVYCDGEECSWRALKSCGNELTWPGLIEGDISQKVITTEGVCADKLGVDGGLWADGLGAKQGGFDCAWYGGQSEEHACGSEGQMSCCEKYGDNKFAPQIWTANEACCACGGGTTPKVPCQGDATSWQSDFGGCDLYAEDRTYCHGDSSEGLTAAQVCPQCGFCKQEDVKARLKMPLDGVNLTALSMEAREELQQRLRQTFAKACCNGVTRRVIVTLTAGSTENVRRLSRGDRVVTTLIHASIEGRADDNTYIDSFQKPDFKRQVSRDVEENSEIVQATQGRPISVGYVGIEESIPRAAYLGTDMVAVGTSKPVEKGHRKVEIDDIYGLSQGMLVKISDDMHSETKTIVKVTPQRNTLRLSTSLTVRGEVELDSELVHDYPREAVVTAEKAPFTSLGSDRACRIDSSDSTISGRGTVQKYTKISSAEECKNLCRIKAGCTGVEFQASRGYCEIWTVAIGYTVSKPGFECWRRGHDCVTDLQKFELMWPKAKKIWCCYQEGKGCSNAKPSYPAGVGYDWKPQKAWGMKVVTWQREPYDCKPGKLMTWNTWSYEQRLWCCKTAPPGSAKDRICHQDTSTMPPEEGMYWQKLEGDGFSFQVNTTIGFHWKKVEGTFVHVPFDCNADLDRFEKVWTSEQKKWCCNFLHKGCSQAKKPIYDAGDGKYWKKEKYEDGSLEGQLWWKPEKVKYRCDADLERFELMWTKDQQKWCCEELGKGCSDCDKEPKYPAGAGFYWECKSKTWERKEAEAADCDQKEKDLTKGLKKWCYDFKHKAFYGEEPPYKPPPQGTRWVKAKRDRRFTWELTEV